MFKVFHMKPYHPAFAFKSDDDLRRAFEHRDDYRLKWQPVALVDAPNVERVFDATNHLDKPWTANAVVTVLGESPASYRSTSVGDIVVDERDNCRMCGAIGWIDLGRVDGMTYE